MSYWVNLGAVIVWSLDLPLLVQSVPNTTKVVSSNLDQGEVYLIQHYVIKFVSDLRQVGDFLRVLRFPPPMKHRHNIAEILLKVVLNTIKQTIPELICSNCSNCSADFSWKSF